MSSYKKGQTTITPLEQTLFGGLAKVLIPKPINDGALRGMVIHYPLTMRYSQRKLKIFKYEMLRDENNNRLEMDINYRDLINFDTDHPFTNEREVLEWRDTIWNFSMYRSLEIWKVLPAKKIESSLGQLTKFGLHSLKGKLGSANGRFFEKQGNGNWEFISFKQTNQQKEFKPFSSEAIECCKRRSRTRSK